MFHSVLDTLVALAVPLLVLMNAFFVSIEFALVSVRWTRIEQLVEQNKPGAKLAAGLVENLIDSLSATQLGITFASLALGWVGEPTIGRALMPFFDGLPLPWNVAFAHGTAIAVAFLCITYLHMVLGELVPRERVVALSRTAKPEDILETARMSAHTRMPVWEGETDNIVGIVNTKDLFHIFSLMGLVILEDAMYPALYIDPDQNLGRALNMFRRERRHMAVVRGMEMRFLGILTLEDIIEEIVGEIEDEHD
jgi:CBS domain containing-hemolysin-like protein